MYHLNTLYATSRLGVFRNYPPIFTTSPATRHIRIKTSDDSDSRPPDSPGNVLEGKDQQKQGSLDHKAQNAKGESVPLSERPAFVHGRVYQSDGTGSASSHRREEAAAKGWWGRLKQVLGGRWWRKEIKQGTSGKSGEK